MQNLFRGSEDHPWANPVFTARGVVMEDAHCLRLLYWSLNLPRLQMESRFMTSLMSA